MTWDEPIVSTLKAYRSWPPQANVRDSGGPERVEHDPDPTFKPRALGFAPPGRHRADVPIDSPSRAKETA